MPTPSAARPLFAAVLVVSAISIAVATGRDQHDFVSDEISPEQMLLRYPLLMDIMKRVGSRTIPLDLVISDYPELWQRMKDDPPVWRWFQKHMPHYTVDRVEGSKPVKKPYRAPSAELQFLLDIEEALLQEHGTAKRAARAALPSGDDAAEVYSRWQVLKWADKNWQRASGRAPGPARAWESHAVDPDYPRWLDRLGVRPGARVLDIGTELGLQSIGLAKLGFEVFGTDVGDAELEVARGYATREDAAVHARLTFVRDDILTPSSSLPNRSFDVVFDRAVYHSMVPYLNAEPRLRAAVDARFASRIKALLRPGGIFVFKGMSDLEDGFRQPNRGESMELNPLTAFRLVQLLMRNHAGVRPALSFLVQSGKVTTSEGPNAAMSALSALAAVRDKSFVPSTLWFDIHDHPMPHHFTALEVQDIFQRRMCFDEVEHGETYLFNDKGHTELMPKARYALLKDGGRVCGDETGGKSEL
jgi:SAM-dependent methyltransferase